MVKLTPPQIIARIIDVAKEYYNVNDNQLRYISRGSTKKAVDCRHAIIAAGSLMTTFTIRYISELIGYHENNHNHRSITKYHTNDNFKKDVDNIINHI